MAQRTEYSKCFLQYRHRLGSLNFAAVHRQLYVSAAVNPPKLSLAQMKTLLAWLQAAVKRMEAEN